MAEATKAPDYDKLDVEELEKLLNERELSVEAGSGKDGTVVKADLVKALQEADEDEDKPEESDGGPVKYSIEQIVQDSYDITGYPSHYAAGALHGRKSPLTADGAKKAIKEWLKGEVEVEER
jgi:hypothetical protein